MNKNYTRFIIFLAFLFSYTASASDVRTYKWQQAKLSECAEAFEDGKVIREVSQYEHNKFFISEGGNIYDFYFNTDKKTFRCSKMKE